MVTSWVILYHKWIGLSSEKVGKSEGVRGIVSIPKVLAKDMTEWGNNFIIYFKHGREGGE